MMGAREERKSKFCLLVFSVCLTISICLMVGGFLCPPQGEIDGSVLTAVGELFAFPALAYGFRAFELGYNLKVSHGNTTIEVNNNDE